jgi:hypothetical protein
MRWFAGAGVACALLASSRLLFAPVPLVVAGWLILRGPSWFAQRRWRCVAAFAGGILVASIPALVLFLHDPDVFMFNNLGYHLLRTDKPSLILQVTSAVVFARDVFLHHPSMLLLLVLLVPGTFHVIRRRPDTTDRRSALAEVALISTTAVILASLTPHPLFEQYITGPIGAMTVPLAALGLQLMWEKVRALAVAVALAAVVFSFMEFKGEQLQAATTRGWHLVTFNRVAAYIKEHTTPDDIVLSPWPGYTTQSGRRYLSGFENHFALTISQRFGEEQRQRYKLGHKDAFIRAIEDQKPTLIILGQWVTPLFITMDEGERKRLYETLLDRYELKVEMEGVFVYERKGEQH